MEIENVQEELIETVEDETLEETEDTVEVDVSDETSETASETEESEEEKSAEDKRKQSADENKKFAEMRRAREEAERKRIEKEAYRKGVTEGLGSINPYTNEKIEDEADFELYQEMKACEEKGYDPTKVSDLTKYRKELKLEEKAKQEASKSSEEKVAKEIQDFTATHPDVDAVKLFKSDDFLKFANDLLGKVPLNSIYDKYNLINKQAEEKAKKLAIKEKARREASPKSQTGGDEALEEVYSLEQIKAMSSEEIVANYNKVYASYRKYLKK